MNPKETNLQTRSKTGLRCRVALPPARRAVGQGIAGAVAEPPPRGGWRAAGRRTILTAAPPWAWVPGGLRRGRPPACQVAPLTGVGPPAAGVVAVACRLVRPPLAPPRPPHSVQPAKRK